MMPVGLTNSLVSITLTYDLLGLEDRRTIAGGWRRHRPPALDVAIQQGSDVIAAVGSEMPTRKRMNSYAAVTTHFNSIYMNNILKSTFALFNSVHHAEIIPILPNFERPVGTFHTGQIPYIIEQGEKAAPDCHGTIY